MIITQKKFLRDFNYPMNKVNNINFTGISNIGVINFQRHPYSVSKSLSMTLCNNYNGKDFSDFNNAVKKAGKSPAYFKDNSNILNIECYKNLKTNNIYINGRYISVCDQNLPIFSYLARLTKKITQMTEMVSSNDYKKYEAGKNLIYGAKITTNYPEIFNVFFEKQRVKDGAGIINDFIQNMMEKYLDI